MPLHHILVMLVLSHINMSLLTNYINREDQCDSIFTEFSGVTGEDVLEIIKGSKIKSCPFNPLPACLLSDNLDLLLQHITAIPRLSLEMVIFPNTLKSALVTPILKKPNLDPEVMKNYRPISNLCHEAVCELS